MSNELHTLALSLLSTPNDHNIPQTLSISIFCDEARIFHHQNTQNCIKFNIRIFFMIEGLTDDERSLLIGLENDMGDKFHFVEIAVTRIASLKSEGLLTDGVVTIVNPTNHRLSDRGGLVNQLIHKTAGIELRDKTLLQVSSDNTSGKGFKAPCVFSVVLSDTNPLRRKEGVLAVIQAVSPNRHPDRPHCEESLESAAAATAQSYREVFMEHLRVIIAQQTAVADEDNIKGSIADQSLVGSKRERQHDAADFSSSVKSTAQSHSVGGQKQPAGGFSFNKNILYEYLKPDLTAQFSRSIYLRTEQCTVIYDSYPKARIHLLVIPNQHYLDVQEVRQIGPQHREQVAVLHTVARKVAAELGGANKSSSNDSSGRGNSSGSGSSGMLLGYHSIPSLHPLHIHVLSRDLDSACMKTKKHWNSFTTPYFLPIDTVDAWLQEGRSVEEQLPSERAIHALLDTPLRCHHCGEEAKNIPTLKLHIKQHL